MHKTEEQFGDVPSTRFGHTITVIDDDRIVMFGGASGELGNYVITNDTYVLRASTRTWKKLDNSVDAPSPRAAHATCSVGNTRLVLYGGAFGFGNLSPDSLYLLDLSSDSEHAPWMEVPCEGPNPGPRYGHTMEYTKPFIIVFGGNNGSQLLNDVWVFNVEGSPFCWHEIQVLNSCMPVPRVYHSVAMCREGPARGMCVIFGGRTTSDQALSDTWGLRQHRSGSWDWVKGFRRHGITPEPRYQHTCIFVGAKLYVVGGRGKDAGHPMLSLCYDTSNSEWSHFPAVSRFRHASFRIKNENFVFGGFHHSQPSAPVNDLLTVQFFENRNIPRHEKHEKESEESDSRNRPRIGNQVMVTVQNTQSPKAQKIHLDQLEEESRRIASTRQQLVACAHKRSLADDVIRHLLRPTDWQEDEEFFLSSDEIWSLCDQVEEILKNTAMLLQLRSPIKVYGDLHGQFSDLMRLFQSYKAPVFDEHDDFGDLHSNDYLFLGDYVDRGKHSLEVILLLFALKIKHPNQIHLIRGNHEDISINANYGFRSECQCRLREDPTRSDSCWKRFNRVFQWLPLGALIEDKILCIHGGIGGTIRSLQDIAEIPRPLEVSQIPLTPIDQRVTDLLWSDPTECDDVLGVLANDTRDPDGTGRIVRFGPDRVEEFLQENKVLMIIRAHECVMDGIERFAGGKMITLFSATDYCGCHNNAGALLFVRRDLTITPKLIFPINRLDSTWDCQISEERPPTPPRR